MGGYQSRVEEVDAVNGEQEQVSGAEVKPTDKLMASLEEQQRRYASSRSEDRNAREAEHVRHEEQQRTQGGNLEKRQRQVCNCKFHVKCHLKAINLLDINITYQVETHLVLANLNGLLSSRPSLGYHPSNIECSIYNCDSQLVEGRILLI